MGSRSAILIAHVCICVLLSATRTQAQTGEYIRDQSPRLQIRVHIIGEVKQPGEYLVPDDTDVMELVSKAGGPSEYADLSSVSVRRVHVPSTPIEVTNGTNGGAADPAFEELVRVDLSAFLRAKSKARPPLLLPDDIVTVPSNGWRTWQRGFSIVRDIAVIASVYLLYLRVK